MGSLRPMNNFLGGNPHAPANRVTPFAEIVAIPERGTMMGNRGGRIHDEHS